MPDEKENLRFTWDSPIPGNGIIFSFGIWKLQESVILIRVYLFLKKSLLHL